MKQTLGAGFEMYTCKIKNQSSEYKMFSLALVIAIASIMILAIGSVVVDMCVEIITL